ncbi:MAG: antitoxin [Candidatus Omnitrophica bacterium]|nr:antitoxin [Candidatus Omnitrophota bacterium]
MIMKRYKLDKYENELLESVNRVEWKPVKNMKQEIRRFQKYARNTLKKDKRVNIRMSSKDLAEIQIVAVKEGLPYQSLMSSILHKFVRAYYSKKARPVEIFSDL